MSKPNEPAFPRSASEDTEYGTRVDGNIVRPAQIGLTKREHFAALAMQGLCANPQPITDKMIADYRIETGRRDAAGTINAYLAEHAVLYADALLSELAKEKS